MRQICMMLLTANLFLGTSMAKPQQPVKEPHALMIVAHPDDESIWGGQHLLDQKGEYVVVCLTSKNNPTRNKEFHQAIKQVHDQGVMYAYPDKVQGKRSQWKKEHKQIEKTIRYWVRKKHWTKIVTHNPDGEYGHQHHRMTSEMVTKEVKKIHETNRLVYFGKYYKKGNLPFSMRQKKMSVEKKNLLKAYGSQKLVLQHLHHMLPYEKWVKYKDWSKQ